MTNWHRSAVGLVWLFSVIVVLRSPLDACTTFCVKAAGQVLFGRNYDFEIGEGLVLTNARGLSKIGIEDPRMRWTAKYGSLTFNQFGRQFPMGGMNEAGLVVELMWLDGTRYPQADSRPALSNLEWIQYQLDTSAAVSDVLRSDTQVRIAGGAPLHFLVSDAAGGAATVEFLDGRLVAHTGRDLPVAVLANDRYRSSIDYLTRLAGSGGAASPSWRSGSLDRFARAAQQVKEFHAETPTAAVERAFAILESVAAPHHTRWSIVYDQTARIVHFRTDRVPTIRRVDMRRFDFGCGAGEKMLDVQASLAGDVTERFDAYSSATNRALVINSHRTTSFTKDTPQADIEANAAQPGRATCTAS